MNEYTFNLKKFLQLINFLLLNLFIIICFTHIDVQHLVILH